MTGLAEDLLRMQRTQTFERQEDDRQDQQPRAKPKHAQQGREQVLLT